MNNKTTFALRSKTCINPWTGISWNYRVPKCDEQYLCNKSIRGKTFNSLCQYEQYINRNDLNGNPNNIGLCFDALPEPFSGDIKSQIYCLNLNPGKPDPFFGQLQDKNNNYENLWKKELSHSQINVNDKKLISDGSTIIKAPNIYDTILKNFCNNSKKVSINRFKVHEGVYWYVKMIEPLKKEISKLRNGNPKIFFIEYFPYHSSKAFSFPKNLPSYAYRDYLIEQAINENKIIIILRGYNVWMNPKTNIGKMLRNYDKTFILYSNRGIKFIPNNIYKVISDIDIKSVLTYF